MPAASSKMLGWHPKSQPFNNSFHWCPVIGMLNYLETCSHRINSYTTHHVPTLQGSQDGVWQGILQEGWLSEGMQMNRLISKPDPTSGLKVYIDADFAGNWNKEEAVEDDNTMRSRMDTQHLEITIADRNCLEFNQM